MLKNSFGQGPFLFRLNDSGSGPSLLNQVCLERGWREYCPESDEENWNLWWKTNSFTTSYTKSLSAWQFTNHIPKGSAICRKDNLARYLRCMKSIYGPIYDFSPNGYNLPLEYTKFAAELNRYNFIPYEKSKLLGECGIWICKPVSKSQGRGIFLFRKLSDLNYDTNAIVQRYIEKPLLIGGYKFDLRLYVCVPSYHPLTIYMYKEGLTRFGTDKFNLNDLSNPFRHLTNCSINKLGPNYTKLKDRIGAGCKWTLISLRRYFLETGIHDWLLWQKISNLVVLTILSHATQIPETFNCFDFLGFDILIDENLRPWLLEVNLSPALSNDCEADRLVKKPMLHDMFDLLGLPLLKTGLGSFDLWHESDADSDPDEGIDVESKASTINRSLGTDSRESLGYIPTRRKSKCSRRVKSKYHSSTKVGFSAAINKTFSRKPLTLAKHTIVLEEQQLKRNEEWKKLRSGKWGNGRDWSHPKELEGDWVRIWPLKLNTNSVTTFKEPLKEVKNIVQEVSKYSRVSKEMIKKHPRASDKFLNQQLRQELDIAGEIWLPPLRSKT